MAAGCRPGDNVQGYFPEEGDSTVAKRLFFGALTSEAVRQLSSFSG